MKYKVGDKIKIYNIEFYPPLKQLQEQDGFLIVSSTGFRKNGEIVYGFVGDPLVKVNTAHWLEIEDHSEYYSKYLVKPKTFNS